MAKVPKNCPNELKTFIEEGLELCDVIFHNNVTSITGEPEKRFHSHSIKPSRKSQLWLTPIGIIMEQQGKYQGVPEAHVKEWKPMLHGDNVKVT